MTLAGIFSKLNQRLRQDLLIPPGDQFDPLNGLRGIACLIVVWCHVAQFGGFFSQSPSTWNDVPLFFQVVLSMWTALDFFFVLSGFLIGRILLISLTTTGGVEFPRFFIRRAMRVFPIYYLVLTLAVFWYTRLDMPYAQLMLVGPDGWAAMRDISWMNYAYIMNYFFKSGDTNPMSWSWSLCVEEHFYMLIPFLLAILYGTKRRGVRPAVLIIATLLPFLGRAFQYFLDPSIYIMNGFYYRTHNRIDEVMVGVVIAYFFVHHYDALRKLVERLGSLCWIGAFVLIGSVWIFGGLYKYGIFVVVFQFLLCALGTGLLILNGLFLNNRVTRILALRLWYPWARISYGIYLIHPFILFFLMTWQWAYPDQASLAPARFLLIYLLTILSSGFVAAISFVCFERPLIDWGVQISKKLKRKNQ